METRRLRVLVELARYGTMAEVADRLDTSTSNVSQQIARLAEDVGARLVEPDGRRIRLTAAGKRLADHALGIIASVDAARADLDPAAEPAGTVRVAGFASAIRRVLLPVLAGLTTTHPRVEIMIMEHEPSEAVQLLLADRLDLALVYDYNLAPDDVPAALGVEPLWTSRWSLGVPATGDHPLRRDGSVDLPALRDWTWIGNSRNDADERVLRVLASMAGFAPSVRHRADSLELVEDLIGAGLGAGLLPADRVTPPAVALLPLDDPPVIFRALLLHRRGSHRWPPVRLVRERIAAQSMITGNAPPDAAEGRSGDGD